MALRFRFLHTVLLSCLAACVLSLAAAAWADPAPFDLTGPKLEVKVTRAGKTLPVSQVPNLAVGDQLSIRADLPQGQSVHYLLVAAFLRGSTNPPPENWFFRSETWNKKDAEGLNIVVPQDAQQILVFLAPETGGDFHTIVGAVRGRPGAFVRASQDLNQATLDRSRLDVYLDIIHSMNGADPAKLKEIAPLLARSLAIKVDDKCLDKIPELQASCLTQGQDALIMNDGHSTSIVEALTSGPAGDLAMQASYTPQLNYGFYSPYLASIMDIARIMDSFHTAQYQYIPALASQEGDKLALRLNTPPSFHNPKSVLVAALPAIEPAQPPPLHAVDPKEIYCARKTSLILPVEGAPLVFSTGYAHGITLSLTGKDGKTIDLPAKADPAQGGLVVDTAGLSSATLGDSVKGSIHGEWGFEKYEGPSFQLENARAQTWELASADQGSLIVGREDTVHLQAASAGCIDTIMLKDPAGKELKADWKTTKPNEVQVTLPLKEAQPGSVTLVVKQFGASEPEAVQLHTFSEAGHLDSFTLHAGDPKGMLKGSRLDEVASLSLNNVEFLPGKLSSADGSDDLPMAAKDVKAAAALKEGGNATAQVKLKDGRTLDLKVSIDAPRPSVELIGKSVQPSAATAGSNIQLSNQDELPQDAKLTFSVRAQSPASFGRNEKIEVATGDGSFTTTLSVENGGMTLEDAKVALATLDVAKAFGPSAFGPLQFRVSVDGAEGDWQPLATLVRLPQLKELQCPTAADQACKLSGSNLFLVDAVASDPQFQHPIQVPDGFPGYTLPVPHPAGGQLYVRLRDDPSVVNQLTLAAEQPPAPPRPAHEPKKPARPDYSGDQPAPSASAPATPSTTPPAAAAPSTPPAAGDSSQAQPPPASPNPNPPASASPQTPAPQSPPPQNPPPQSTSPQS